MKKYYFTAIILSFIGLILSGFLVADHYLPEMTVSFLKCGDGLYNSCSEVSFSPYSKIFGIPFSVLGFFFYLWILLSCFIFRESSMNFWKQFSYILLPVAIAGVAADIYFGGLLIYIGLFCKYCVATYVVNIFLLVNAVLFYKAVRSDNPENYISRIKRFFSDAEISEYIKFSTGAYIFFSALMFLFMISFTLYMNEVADQRDNSAAMTDVYLREYLNIEKKEYSFTAQGFTVGEEDAPLEIIVVTDPLCSACYSFYGSEKHLLQKYYGKIKFRYYFYPLDSNCNEDVTNTVYTNSCKAAKSIIAASTYIPFEEALENFYINYDELHEMYRKGYYDKLVFDSMAVAGKTNMKSYNEKVNSEETQILLKGMISTSMDNEIEATPTFFINGRKVEGAPYTNVFERIIEYELKQINKK